MGIFFHPGPCTGRIQTFTVMRNKGQGFEFAGTRDAAIRTVQDPRVSGTGCAESVLNTDRPPVHEGNMTKEVWFSKDLRPGKNND